MHFLLLQLARLLLGGAVGFLLLLAHLFLLGSLFFELLLTHLLQLCLPLSLFFLALQLHFLFLLRLLLSGSSLVCLLFHLFLLLACFLLFGSALFDLGTDFFTTVILIGLGWSNHGRRLWNHWLLRDDGRFRSRLHREFRRVWASWWINRLFHSGK